MRERPKPKHAVLRVRLGGSTTTIDKAEGILSSSNEGALFCGNWDDAESTAMKVTFPGWMLRTAGQPKKTARDRMTGILKNYLAIAKHSVRSREIAEELEGRNPRTLARDRKVAMKYVRAAFELELDDGSRYAVALMRDGQARGLEMRGPAWILREGENYAEFISDFKVLDPDHPTKKFFLTDTY